MHGTKLSGSFSIVALVGLAVHSFVDGIVMAGAFEASESMGNKVAWALIIHKIPDGFVMSALMAANRNNRDFYSGITLFRLHVLFYSLQQQHISSTSQVSHFWRP